MVLKYRVVLLWVVCLLFKVVLIRCGVILVNRNLTDSFRVGEDGCTENNDCTDHGTCQSGTRLCLCSDSQPNYLNYSVINSSTTSGCLRSDSIRSGAGGFLSCSLGPFQLIPYIPAESAVQFSDQHDLDKALTSCSLRQALGKFPDNVTETELQWLDETYINLIVLNKTLLFKWNKPVPGLRGTIIRFNLHCLINTGSYNPCLRAKIYGIWPEDENPTVDTPVLTKNTVIKPATSHLTSTPSTYSNPTKEASSEEDDSNGTIIIIAVVVPVVLLIVLIVFIWLLGRRKRRNRNHVKKPATLTTKKFKHTNSTLRGPNAYGEGKAKGTAETFGAQTNPAYSTLDRNTRNDVKSQEDPGYATPDIVRKIPDIKANPFYGATPNSTGKGYDITQSEPGYKTPNLKREEMNTSGYSTFDAQNSNSDIKRVEINGDLYALPNKGTVKIDGLSYMDPSHLTPGSQEKNKDQNESDQPTEYADIVGVMKPKPDKTGEKRKKKK